MVHTTTTMCYKFLICVAIIGAGVTATDDAFDEINMKLGMVTSDNCRTIKKEDLFLPEDSVSHVPNLVDTLIDPVSLNRTALLYLQNLALTRSFFWSYIVQTRFIRPDIRDATYDPGMMYYLLSTVADVASNSLVNASAIYFAPHSSFSPSFYDFYNQTYPRFAPRTYRMDSPLNSFDVRDLGATPEDYTTDDYKTNEWYSSWLPDKVERHDTKATYLVEIQYGNNTNQSLIFNGPPGMDDTPGPVKYIRPYFDCGRTNKWLISTAAPVADIFPRHTDIPGIEYPRYTAVSVLEMNFEKIDINQCPLGSGNELPNRFAGTNKCKSQTTKCEPLPGYGFNRDGYQCSCRPGYRKPNIGQNSYLGEKIGNVTRDLFRGEFDCIKIQRLQELPVSWDKLKPEVINQYLEAYPEYKNATTGVAALNESPPNVQQILDFISEVNPKTCENYNPADLILREQFSFGAREQFQNEAKMATRLANFISAFLQVSDTNQVYTGKRVSDNLLTEDQMIGETLAIVMGNMRINSAGVYWEKNKFSDRAYFAPLAYKKAQNIRRFNVEDLARSVQSDATYTDLPFYREVKNRWSTNFDSLEKYQMNLRARNNENGDGLKQYEKIPNHYRGASLNHGYWVAPKFDCKGLVKRWQVTYAVPFFGFDNYKINLEFKGVVAVSIDLMHLDINQCSDGDVSNAFRDTHKCDKKTSRCVPVPGRGFDKGGYKCECLQGHEYPLNEPTNTFSGELLESEFEHAINNKETRINILKCRVSGASSNNAAATFIGALAMSLSLFFFNNQ